MALLNVFRLQPPPTTKEEYFVRYAQTWKVLRAGSFEQAYVTLTQGVHLGAGEDVAEQLVAQRDAVADRAGETIPANAWAQGALELQKASAK